MNNNQQTEEKANTNNPANQVASNKPSSNPKINPLNKEIIPSTPIKADANLKEEKADEIPPEKIMTPQKEIPIEKIIPLTVSLISQINRKNSHQPEHPSKRWGHTAILNNLGMIVYGGRLNQRNISSIYSLDFRTLSWTKIDQIGQSPLSRDSHSAVPVSQKLFYLINLIFA